MKKQKLINLFKLGILVFGVILCFTNCEANKDYIEEASLEYHTPKVLSEKISFTQSKHFSEINGEIKSIQSKFNKKQTSKENQSETGSLKILTDEILYVTYAGTHTYTFKVVRKNPTYLLENIVLHYNLRTKSYDEYLMQYKDLKEQDIKEISEGKFFQDSKKLIVTKLENGFFESYSASNKASSTSKASSVICTTTTSTIWVDCSSQGAHHQGNIGEWYKCTATVKPSAYQSSSTTCTVTSNSSPTEIQEIADTSSAGGANNPNVIVYNPLPLEPCDNSNEVDLNGNCIQPIDLAVSYIANCLSSNYSPALSQSEINFLYSTNSSFEIKSYLENNGCSSESKAFAIEAINSIEEGGDVDLAYKVIVDKSFKDNPCLNGVYEKLGQAPTFDNYLKNFNKNFSVANLKLKANTNLPDTINAQTSPPSNYLITIDFNKNNLNRPSLDIARTFIHEMIHAEMFRILLSLSSTNGEIDVFKLNTMLTEHNYPGLYDYYRRFGVNDMQHEQMAAHYRGIVVNLLKEYDNTLTNDQYQAIAWIGLKGTIAWKRLNDSERQNTTDLYNTWYLSAKQNCQ
jgi:hypothetical protein